MYCIAGHFDQHSAVEMEQIVGESIKQAEEQMLPADVFKVSTYRPNRADSTLSSLLFLTNVAVLTQQFPYPYILKIIPYIF